MSNPYRTGKKECKHPADKRIWIEKPLSANAPRVACRRCGKRVRLVNDKWVAVDGKGNIL